MTRGTSEAEIKGMTFALNDSILLLSTSHDSIHIFDLKDTFKEATSKSFFNKLQSGISHYWTGDIRARFILDKPKATEVAIFSVGEELMIITKKGQYYWETNFKKKLDDMAKGNDREKIEFDGCLYSGDYECILTDSDVL